MLQQTWEFSEDISIDLCLSPYPHPHQAGDTFEETDLLHLVSGNEVIEGTTWKLENEQPKGV